MIMTMTMIMKMKMIMIMSMINDGSIISMHFELDLYIANACVSCIMPPPVFIGTHDLA